MLLCVAAACQADVRLMYNISIMSGCPLMSGLSQSLSLDTVYITLKRDFVDNNEQVYINFSVLMFLLQYPHAPTHTYLYQYGVISET